MTENLLLDQPVARPVRPSARPMPQPALGAPAQPRSPVKPRVKAEARRPLHLAVAIGFSVGAYAMALAGVTALQSSKEQALVADHAPTSDVIDQLRLDHDRLEARIVRATAAYNQAVAAYGTATGGIGSYEQKLGILAQEVATAQSDAASATGPGSGQGAAAFRSSSGGSTGGAAALPTITRAAAAPAPAVQATTCASGKVCP